MVLLAVGPGERVATTDDACSLAMSFVVEQVGMFALSEPDTIDDWRTRQKVAGCRITAAGLTTQTLQAEATLFYERLREAGWTRTPDPRDAPNEASLRFRMAEVDCLFNFYSGSLLGTEAEAAVSRERVPGKGQQRFNFLVMCMPAMEAAARQG
jgi:hypothetical protein